MPISPEMNLIIPTTGTTPGPDYADDINSSLTLIDLHDHSPGKGVAISPAGMNINADLEFNGHFVLEAAGIEFDAQGATPDVFTMYANGVDLYYVDGLGNNIRMTQSGGVAGTPGSIANLVAPASATYVAGSKTFVWQSNASTSANMDAASYIMRNITPNSTFALTIAPPAGLAQNFTITLPTLPVANSFMQISTLGVISNTIPVANGITADNIGIGVQIPTVIADIDDGDSPYSVIDQDGMIAADTTSGNITVNLQPAADAEGKRLIIKKTAAANVVTIVPDGSETIDGQANYKLLGNYDYITIISDGANWQVIDRDLVQLVTDAGNLGSLPGTGAMWYAQGCTVTLTEGDWELTGSISWGTTANGVDSPRVGWFGADGANNNSTPASISNASVLGGFEGTLDSNNVGNSNSRPSATILGRFYQNAPTITLRVLSGGATIYLVGGHTSASGTGLSVSAIVTAKRLR